jgi:uncharacterized phage protein (TIGR01671 family)
MSREIKFKYIWSNPEKTNFITEIFTLDEIEAGNQFMVLENEPLLKDYKLIARVQFIGLLDKNGKKIFEGDLLQYDGYNFKLINKEKIYQIRYDDNLGQYYSYNLENSFDTFLVVRAWKESIIIGNIYQNPELLGGENE